MRAPEVCPTCTATPREGCKADDGVPCYIDALAAAQRAELPELDGEEPF